MKESRKAINFDLDERKLKKLYPSRFPFAYKHAWSDIKRFMEKNGFEHRQYSGYVSRKPMSYTEVIKTMEKLRSVYPWIGPCAQKFDVTEVGKTYSLLELLRRDPEKEIHMPTPHTYQPHARKTTPYDKRVKQRTKERQHTEITHDKTPGYRDIQNSER